MSPAVLAAPGLTGVGRRLAPGAGQLGGDAGPGVRSSMSTLPQGTVKPRVWVPSADEARALVDEALDVCRVWPSQRMGEGGASALVNAAVPRALSLAMPWSLAPLHGHVGWLRIAGGNASRETVECWGGPHVWLRAHVARDVLIPMASSMVINGVSPGEVHSSVLDRIDVAPHARAWAALAALALAVADKHQHVAHMLSHLKIRDLDIAPGLYGALRQIRQGLAEGNFVAAARRVVVDLVDALEDVERIEAAGTTPHVVASAPAPAKKGKRGSPPINAVLDRVLSATKKRPIDHETVVAVWREAGGSDRRADQIMGEVSRSLRAQIAAGDRAPAEIGNVPGKGWYRKPEDPASPA